MDNLFRKFRGEYRFKKVDKLWFLIGRLIVHTVYADETLSRSIYDTRLHETYSECVFPFIILFLEEIQSIPKKTDLSTNLLI